MKQPNWCTLERHPLSAAYVDISGDQWTEFVVSMHANGFDKRKPITLFEGKILDGWQRYRACRELGIKPTFVKLPDGVDPEAFVERENDHRRHEDHEARKKRIAHRRAQATERRARGESTRRIAKDLGVDQKTVRNDLRAGEDMSSPETSNSLEKPQSSPEKTTGIDGKRYSSKKVKAPTIICARCQELVASGDEAIQDCTGCAYERERKKHGRVPEVKNSYQDGAGRQVPVWLNPVWAAKPLFRTAAKDFGKAVASLEALEKSEALKYGTGEDYHRFHVVLRNIKYRLLGGEPKLVCPLCEGERIEGCERCGGKGWLSIADESKLAENRPASRK